MNELPTKYEITKREMNRGRNLKVVGFSAPLVLSLVPAIITIITLFLFGSTPPVAATIFFLGAIVTVIGFVKGLIISGIMAYKHRQWSTDIRERMAADGIRAEEIEWFRHELKPSEKRSLKELQRSDLLLADAYRETLASRLTATRIIRSSKKELALTRRREAKLKMLKSGNAEEFLGEIRNDLEKLNRINNEAKEMLAEAESRMQMIESAALRGSGMADSELALKKLSARSQSLPLALEEAKMTDELRRELESDLAKEK
ncbi:MAG: hypothetical protein QUS14_08460 [Pyrinomonadaceae bacterium]|nr:hypothetical protein [Pyrinomonadaceae bacterium]